MPAELLPEGTQLPLEPAPSHILVEQRKRCPYCVEEIQRAAKKCRFCGEWLACWRCGSEMREGTRFCGKCGAPRVWANTADLQPDYAAYLEAMRASASSAEYFAPASSPPPEQSVPWGWMDLVKVLGVFVALGVACAILVGVLHALSGPVADNMPPGLEGLGLTGGLASFTVWMIGFYAALAAAIYICVIRKYRLTRESIGLRRVRLRDYATTLLTWPLVAMASGLALTIVSHTFLGGQVSNPQTQEIAATGAPRSAMTLVILLLTLAVMAPIVEETLFRGLLYPLLRRRLPGLAAVPICSGIFALAHGIPLIMPSIFVIGLALTMTFVRTKSLYPGMLLHGVQNAVVTVVIWSSFS